MYNNFIRFTQAMETFLHTYRLLKYTGLGSNFAYFISNKKIVLAQKDSWQEDETYSNMYVKRRPFTCYNLL